MHAHVGLWLEWGGTEEDGWDTGLSSFFLLHLQGRSRPFRKLFFYVEEIFPLSLCCTTELGKYSCLTKWRSEISREVQRKFNCNIQPAVAHTKIL